MADEEKIELHRKEFETYSDDKLLNALHSWVPHSAMHIAAKQVLAKREKQFSLKQFEVEKSTNLLTKIILALTVVLLVVALAQFSQSFGIFAANPLVSENQEAANQNTNNADKLHNEK